MKSTFRQESRRGPVQMAVASAEAPQGRDPLLPDPDVPIRCLTVFGKVQTAAWPQHPFHFTQNLADVANAAQRPSDHNGIETTVCEREIFRACL